MSVWSVLSVVWKIASETLCRHARRVQFNLIACKRTKSWVQTTMVAWKAAPNFSTDLPRLILGPQVAAEVSPICGVNDNINCLAKNKAHRQKLRPNLYLHPTFMAKNCQSDHLLAASGAKHISPRQFLLFPRQTVLLFPRQFAVWSFDLAISLARSDWSFEPRNQVIFNTRIL